MKQQIKEIYERKIVNKENPESQGSYFTDKGELFYFENNVWSCREDKVSEEYPTWWLEEKFKNTESDIYNIIDEIIGRHCYQTNSFAGYKELCNAQEEIVKFIMGLYPNIKIAKISRDEILELFWNKLIPTIEEIEKKFPTKDKKLFGFSSGSPNNRHKQEGAIWISDTIMKRIKKLPK